MRAVVRARLAAAPGDRHLAVVDALIVAGLVARRSFSAFGSIAPIRWAASFSLSQHQPYKNKGIHFK
ncbi:hypothetical protein [Paraburkholderia sp. C35]|uniref:hypothetical protein n=1 Tax=Paraburkholderia sp. C35 TaxID=2126993 RepID=UPI0013A5723F|nr:hypothetical protein [Paraburkholderia sp. C35]